jgi:hypothetical protein
MNPYNYPASPAIIAPEKLNPSPAFRKQVAKVITAIILFFIVYTVLVIAAIALAIACCYFGIMLIVALPKFITLIAGLGIGRRGHFCNLFPHQVHIRRSKNENPYHMKLQNRSSRNYLRLLNSLVMKPKRGFQRRYLSLLK